MDELVGRIRKKIAERKFCTIFEQDVSKLWPCGTVERDRQKAQIEAFAKSHGWVATISNPGIRVTFRDPKR